MHELFEGVSTIVGLKIYTKLGRLENNKGSVETYENPSKLVRHIVEKGNDGSAGWSFSSSSKWKIVHFEVPSGFLRWKYFVLFLFLKFSTLLTSCWRRNMKCLWNIFTLDNGPFPFLCSDVVNYHAYYYYFILFFHLVL